MLHLVTHDTVMFPFQWVYFQKINAICVFQETTAAFYIKQLKWYSRLLLV